MHCTCCTQSQCRVCLWEHVRFVMIFCAWFSFPAQSTAQQALIKWHSNRICCQAQHKQRPNTQWITQIMRLHSTQLFAIVRILNTQPISFDFSPCLSLSRSLALSHSDHSNEVHTHNAIWYSKCNQVECEFWCKFCTSRAAVSRRNHFEYSHNFAFELRERVGAEPKANRAHGILSWLFHVRLDHNMKHCLRKSVDALRHLSISECQWTQVDSSFDFRDFY